MPHRFKDWHYKPNGLVPCDKTMPDGLSRVACGVEYDGNAYHGWQKQQSVPSVQQDLEQALSKVANEPIKVSCAGRTDTAVHAIGQVVHFDTHTQRTDDNWLLGSNTFLSRAVSVTWVKQVSPQFHARFSATSRTYRYVICNRKSRPAILSSGLTWIRDKLDADAMAQGLALLHGEHDFTSFRGSGCQSKSAKRSIFSSSVVRKNEWVIIEVQANAFLLHMVRNIVGSLLEVGRGNIEPSQTGVILEQKDRKLAYATAPPFGLYLKQVAYPNNFNIPNNPYGLDFLHAN